MRTVAVSVLLTIGLAVQQAAATGWTDVDTFRNPSNTNNQCVGEQAKGLGFNDHSSSNLGSYGALNWQNLKCTDGLQKRTSGPHERGSHGKAPTGFAGGRCASGQASKDVNTSPKFSCGAQQEGMSIDHLHVSTSEETDIELHYGYDNGDVCKQTETCSPAGKIIKNHQCGDAKSVTVKLPDTDRKEKCEVGIHSIGFNCGPSSKPPVPTSTPVTSPPVESTPVISTPPETTSQETKPYPYPSANSTTPAGPTTAPSSTPTPESSSISSTSTGDVPFTSTTSEFPTIPVYTNTSVSSTSPVETIPTTVTPGTTVPVVTTEVILTTLTTCPVTNTVTSGSSTSLETTSTISTVFITTETSTIPQSPDTSTVTEIPQTSTVPPNPETTPISSTTGNSPETLSSTSTSTICTQCVPPPPASGTPAPPPATVATPIPSGTGNAQISETSAPIVPPSAPAPSPPAPCPSVLPSCMKTWITMTPCKDNADWNCYCQDAEFTKTVQQCVSAWAPNDNDVQSALSFFAGICADHVSKNPAIITNVPKTITLVPTPASPASSAGTSGAAIPPASPASSAGTSGVAIPPASLASSAGTSGVAIPPASLAPENPVAGPPANSPVGATVPPPAPVPVTTLSLSQSVPYACPVSQLPDGQPQAPASSSCTSLLVTQVIVPQVGFTTGPAAPGVTSSNVVLAAGSPAPAPANPTQGPLGNSPAGATTFGTIVGTVGSTMPPGSTNPVIPFIGGASSTKATGLGLLAGVFGMLFLL
ncbi:MAG: hypothetical protein L6R40_003856 [Gallowayella cf. fulva]|nr:MAG: hypothetical protein L6R40_003856 [Xanthomendoza cf. fulva]